MGGGGVLTLKYIHKLRSLVSHANVYLSPKEVVPPPHCSARQVAGHPQTKEEVSPLCEQHVVITVVLSA